ncbi:MAG: flagellar hook-basal body complex protein FliE [Terracidiphilus sp.]|jgi:flagellar hook-basal body complex protein FliE
MSNAVSGLGAIGNIGALPNFSPASPAETGGSFGDVLSNALHQVNQLNGGAEQQISTMLKGGNADMSTVMIAIEKADVAFQLMMQVRNKIVSAYQDIEKMQF